MRFTLLALGLAAAGWAAHGVAGTRDVAQSGDSDGARILNASEIRDLTAGKTFHYRLLGRPRGEEQHYTDGRVVWRLPDGLCLHGVWAVDDTVLCYYYGAMRYGCWNVVEQNGAYWHSPLELDGTPNEGPVVNILRISEEDVGCAPQQLASLPH